MRLKQELALGHQQGHLQRLMYGFLRPGEQCRANSSDPTRLGSSLEMDCGLQEGDHQARRAPIQAGEAHFLACPKALPHRFRARSMMAQTRQTMKDEPRKDQVALGVSWEATSNGHRVQASTMLGRSPRQDADDQMTTASVYVARVRH